ncbi:response regulator [Pseudomonas lalucatii]|nr:response regulator [Pseudomonas lalucatii]
MSTHNLRLLLIEDDEDDYLITRDLLRESGQLRYQLDWVSDYEAALTALEQRAHDLYLVDYRLGTENGLDLIAHAQGLGIRAPLILLTGQGDDELDASAIDMGAADYLIKGEFNSQMLVRSIRYALGRVHARDALASSEARYRLLFETNPEAVYVVHQQSLAFLAVNPAAVKAHGYSREELLRMTVADILAPKNGNVFWSPSLRCSTVTVHPTRAFGHIVIRMVMTWRWTCWSISSSTTLHQPFW